VLRDLKSKYACSTSPDVVAAEEAVDGDEEEGS